MLVFARGRTASNRDEGDFADGIQSADAHLLLMAMAMLEHIAEGWGGEARRVGMAGAPDEAL